MKLRLPILVERTLAEAKALQVQTGTEYEQQLRQHGSTLSCTKRCAHCCYHPFLISLAEGVLLYRSLRAQSRWTSSLKKRLQATRDKTLGLAFDIWLLSNIPCPLLVDNECSAYESRPLHCRTTFSTGDPLMCHPHELGEATKLTNSTDVVINFHVKLRSLLKRLDVTTPLMPLSEAVLLGEAVETGAIAIEDALSRYSEDLRNV